MESALQCIICHDTVQIPVKLKFPCFTKPINPCSAMMCLKCARDWLKLNDKTKSTPNCLICHNTQITGKINAKNTYEINYDLMKVIDSLNIKDANICRRCDTDCGSQFGLHRHYRGELRDSDQFEPCPYSHTSCIYGCGVVIVRKDFENHKKICRKLPRCFWCQERLNNEHSQDTCPQRKIRCSTCKYDIPYVELDDHLNVHFSKLKKMCQKKKLSEPILSENSLTIGNVTFTGKSKNDVIYQAFEEYKTRLYIILRNPADDDSMNSNFNYEETFFNWFFLRLNNEKLKDTDMCICSTCSSDSDKPNLIYIDWYGYDDKKYFAENLIQFGIVYANNKKIFDDADEIVVHGSKEVCQFLQLQRYNTRNVN